MRAILWAAALGGVAASSVGCSGGDDTTVAPTGGDGSGAATGAGGASASGDTQAAGAGGGAGASTPGTGGAGGAGGTGGAGGAGGTGGAGGAAGGVQPACTAPVFETTDPNGGWSDGGYYVHNNMWNSSAGLGPEHLYACSYHNWYVVSNQTNNAGAVKTYPNVHKDYGNVPISSFHAITSTFAETSPRVGIYDVAYDIWTNGIASAGSTEFMIWNDNFNQVPAGSKVTTATFGGRAYDVFKTSNNSYIAFVPAASFASGTVDILEIFNWTMSKGWLASGSTLGQICFGVEVVSTGSAEATFTFSDFSITSN